MSSTERQDYLRWEEPLDPDETKPYWMDWRLQMQEMGETIATSVWALDAQITEVSSTHTNLRASLMVTPAVNAVVGLNYEAKNTITTNLSVSILSRTGVLRIRNL